MYPDRGLLFLRLQATEPTLREESRFNFFITFGGVTPLSEVETFCRTGHDSVLESSVFFRNSGKLSLVPYTKDFGRITHF
jgi:hypothetical protein